MSGDLLKRNPATADNTAYTLRAYALALRDIALFGRNVVYAGNVSRSLGTVKEQVVVSQEDLNVRFECEI
jgi:hypothetical protein